jgi:5'-nucleotidase
MQNRRDFLKWAGSGALLASLGTFPFDASSVGIRRLTILHTNDVHSHLEPFPDNHPQFPGMGGAAARKALIDCIRAEGHPVLLLDAGDIFQGTPYFNFFSGEPEIVMMNQMGYDAATLGNHDFDGGMENLARQVNNAHFTFISSNYTFHNNVLNNLVKPNRVIEKRGIRIGILGLGIELSGLVPEKLYEGTVYDSPVEAANQTASFLKKKMRCHLVVALSHLGYRYPDNKISDVKLAENTDNIDIIIGGHTHTFMEKPDIRKNIKGENVLIHQAGWAGVRLGRIDVFFEKNLNKNRLSTQTVIVDKKSIAF